MSDEVLKEVNLANFATKHDLEIQKVSLIKWMFVVVGIPIALDIFARHLGF